MKKALLIALLLAAALGAYTRMHARPAADAAVRAVPADVPAPISLQFTEFDAAYVQTELRGWTVIVNRRLLDGPQQALANRALALLDRKLADIERTVYRFPLRKLQRVPIWIENATTGLHGLAYHWSAQWLQEHGYNPEKARAVEIHDIRDFIEWEPMQPWFVMRELAHAYHDRALGENNENIAAAYRNALASGLYASVRHRDGSSRRAYALTNAMEYFAELSEAYLGVNDFQPFDRAELQRYDPQGFALMEKVWRN